jgi:WD40 repeat protein
LISSPDRAANLPPGPPVNPPRSVPAVQTPKSPGIGAKNTDLSFVPLTEDPNEEPRQLKHPSIVRSLAWLEDGRLATGCYDGTVRIWDLQTGRGTLYALGAPWKPIILALVPDPDSPKRVKALFLADPNTIYLWSVASTEQPKPFAQMPTLELSGALAPNRERLGICIRNTIEVWDFQSQTLIHRTSIPSALLGKLSFSSAGDQLVACDVPVNKLIVWPIGDQPALQLRGYSTAVFQPDGSAIAAQTVGQGSRTRLLDPANGGILREFNLSTGVGPLAFSQNGLVLASGFSDGTFEGVGFWDTKYGQLLGRVKGGKFAAGPSAFRADGTALAAIDNQEVKLWRTPGFVERVARSKASSPVREQAPPPRTVRP